MVDESYLAPDCFHLSAKGQAAMAAGLWNNMLEPVGEKSITYDETRFVCEKFIYLFIYSCLAYLSFYINLYLKPHVI